MAPYSHAGTQGPRAVRWGLRQGLWVAALTSSVTYAYLLALHMWLFAREAGGYAAMRPRLREVVSFVRVALSGS